MTPPTRPLSPRPRPAPTPRLHLGLRTCGFSLPRHPPRLLAPRGLPLHERGCLRRGGSSGRGSAPQSRPRPTAPPALPPPAPLHPCTPAPPRGGGGGRVHALGDPTRAQPSAGDPGRRAALPNALAGGGGRDATGSHPPAGLGRGSQQPGCGGEKRKRRSSNFPVRAEFSAPALPLLPPLSPPAPPPQKDTRTVTAFRQNTKLIMTVSPPKDSAGKK